MRGMGFCMGFSASLFSGNKSRNPLSLVGQRVFVELLGGFEPPTSSLPILQTLFFPVVSCCTLSPQSFGRQQLAGFTFCILSYLDANFFALFSGVGMGFVWVSVESSLSRPHLYICALRLPFVKICDILSVALHKTAGG